MLKDQVILIAGGAGLIGRTFCLAAAHQGGTIAIADISLSAATETASSIQQTYPDIKLHPIAIDITNQQSVDDVIETLDKKYGRIDALVNCAYPKAKNFGKKYHDISYDDFCETLNIHLGGYFLTSQRCGIYFSRQNHGNIINLSSIYGVSAPRFELYDGSDMTMPIEYAATKSALIHMTKFMATYYKGKNIRANCISPGGILDGQPEKFLSLYKNECLNKGMLNENDLTGTLIYLLSDLSRYVNGQNIIVDDGWSL